MIMIRCTVKTADCALACASNLFNKKSLMDETNRLFATAREEIELAMDSKDTVYFNEEAATARQAVDACLAAYEDLLASLDETKRTEAQRSMGLKMEQLKAELAALNEH
eukprot:jgi/Mesvir1/16461/Mv03881-RA.1